MKFDRENRKIAKSLEKTFKIYYNVRVNYCENEILDAFSFKND